MTNKLKFLTKMSLNKKIKTSPNKQINPPIKKAKILFLIIGLFTSWLSKILL